MKNFISQAKFLCKKKGCAILTFRDCLVCSHPHTVKDTFISCGNVVMADNQSINTILPKNDDELFVQVDTIEIERKEKEKLDQEATNVEKDVKESIITNKPLVAKKIDTKPVFIVPQRVYLIPIE